MRTLLRAGSWRLGLVRMVIVLASAASPAAAQPEPWAPERITAGWVFTPSAVFGGMWDSNPTLRNEGVMTTPEVVGLVSPRGEIDFNGRRAKFNLGYAGTLETYNELDELTRYDQRGRFEARYRMTPRLGFRTLTTLNLSPTTDQLDLFGVPYARVGSRMLTSRGGFTFEVTPRTTLTATHEFQWIAFERGPRDAAEFAFLRGGHAHSPSAELLYALSRRLKAGATYEYRRTVIDAAEQIIDTHQALGTVQYEAMPGLVVRGNAGAGTLELSDRAGTEVGPSFGGSGSYRTRLITAEAGYERAFIPSFGFGSSVPIRMTFARASGPIARGRLAWSAGYVLRRSEPVAAAGLNIALDSTRLNLSLGYHLARWLRMDAFYSGTHQVSTAQGNIDRARIGVQLVTFKPVRIQ